MRHPERNILDLVVILKRQPWLPQKVLARTLQVDQRLVSTWLRNLEVEVRPGVDPDNGRANVNTYAIALPKRKRRALR